MATVAVVAAAARGVGLAAEGAQAATMVAAENNPLGAQVAKAVEAMAEIQVEEGCR